MAVAPPMGTDTLLASFTYDGAGRRTQRTPADGSPSTTYAYDGLGALTGVTRSDGTTAALGYGPLRRRITRSEGGATFAYPDASVELRGAAAFRVLQGPGPLRLAEVEATAGGHRVHQLYPDGSRNLARVATTDEAGATALEPPRRLEAFGAVRSGSSVTEHAFAGQPFEGATGLVYMNARHYDPATGTFLQTDPLGIEAGELYAYARGNPYRFWDPSGMVPQSLNADAQPPHLGRSKDDAGQYPRLAGGDAVSEMQALRHAHETRNPHDRYSAVDHGSRGVGAFGDAYLQVEHAFGEVVAIEAAFVAGVVLTGSSIVATGLAVRPCRKRLDSVRFSFPSPWPAPRAVCISPPSE